MDNSEVVDVLNDLVETSKDGEYGFATCAERATSVELKQIFLRRASDCARAVSELQAIVMEYGGKAEDSGTVAGAVHRGWVSVRDALSGTSDQAPGVLPPRGGPPRAPRACSPGRSSRARPRLMPVSSSDLSPFRTALTATGEYGPRRAWVQAEALRLRTALVTAGSPGAVRSI